MLIIIQFLHRAANFDNERLRSDVADKTEMKTGSNDPDHVRLGGNPRTNEDDSDKTNPKEQG